MKNQNTRPRLRIAPCTADQAKKFIKQYHRHHRPPLGMVFRLSVIDQDRRVRGVATVGRPVSRHLDDGFTVEVNRVATDGCDNACSALLGGARRIAFSMGYARIVTYTLPKEGGASLRGAGWEHRHTTRKEKGWARPGSAHLNRRDDHPLGIKNRWESINEKANTEPIVWPEFDLNAEKQLALWRCVE